MNRKRNANGKPGTELAEVRRVGRPPKVAEPTKPRGLSVRLASAGVRTSIEFAELMSALMGDVAMGNVTPQISAAICNAGGKLLKVHEMQQRYGIKPEGGHQKILQLV